jgi:3-hydroxyisobutyrate dehydrogenase
MEKIAFIGLGRMGGPMAANLVKAGYDVVGCDLIPAARANAAKDGIRIAASARDAVHGADVTITMLPTGKHVIALLTGLVPAIKKGSLLIECSTIDVDSARAAHALASEAGLISVDAPVSGGTKGAAEGTFRRLSWPAQPIIPACATKTCR